MVQASPATGVRTSLRDLKIWNLDPGERFSMSDREELENQGFKVKDRRRFHPDGTPVEDAGETSSAPGDAEPASDFEKAEPASEEEPGAEIPADFSSLVLSLAAGAQTALG